MVNHILFLLIFCSCVSFTPSSYYNGVVSYEEYIEHHCKFSHTETNQMAYITKGHYEKPKLDCYVCDEKEVKCI